MIEHMLVFDEERRLWEACEQYLRETVDWVAATGRRPGAFFSGGSSFIPFYERLGDLPADVFVTDDRLVPPGSAADTGAMLEREWYSRLVEPQSSLRGINRLGDAASTAEAFDRDLRAWNGQGGVWAAALLGVGSDGHTASLFPGQQNIWEGNPAWALATQPEQEPFVPRVTVSQTLLREVPRHIVVLTGSGKTDIARRWLKERERLPISSIEPADERFVLLDRIAARDLPSSLYDLR